MEALGLNPCHQISEGRSVMSNTLRPHGLYNPWNSPGQNTGAGSLSLLQGDLPDPGIETRSPALQADSLPVEPPGKPICPLTDERIKKLWYIYTMEYYSAIKRNTFESVLMR